MGWFSTVWNELRASTFRMKWLITNHIYSSRPWCCGKILCSIHVCWFTFIHIPIQVQIHQREHVPFTVPWSIQSQVMEDLRVLQWLYCILLGCDTMQSDILRTWRLRQHICLECCYSFARPHNVMTQMTVWKSRLTVRL